MRAVIQRVNSASVKVGDNEISSIKNGLLVFLGVKESDTDKDVDYLADKVSNLRIFEDKDKKMNLSALDIKGDILAVSQFTLYGDARKGRRPGFSDAANPEKADQLYEKFIETLKKTGLKIVTGKFREKMNVKLENNGPVTILLDSERKF